MTATSRTAALTALNFMLQYIALIVVIVYRAFVTAVIAPELDYSIFNDDLVTSEDYQKRLDTFFYISGHNIQDYLEEIDKINKEDKKK